MILVTGATGQIGGLVVERLRTRGADVRALVRDPSAAVLPKGIDVVAGDLSHAESLAPALRGVGAVFLLWHQASTEHPTEAIDAIARSTRRIVYVSSLTVRDDLPVQTHPMTVIHAQIEGAIRRSGMAWTFLRAGMFDSNVLGWAAELRTTDVVRRPYPDAGRSPIDGRDVADAAAASLLCDGHEGATYTLTGPQRWTEAELVRIVGEVVERPYRVEAIEPEVARREMREQGVPSDLVDAALLYWRQLVTEPEPVTTDVERLTGSPALPFRRWAQEHASSFV